MPKILDNRELKLKDELNKVMADATRLDACVGYFNLRGWSELSATIDRLPEGEPSRILVGMSVNPNDQLMESLRLSFLDGANDHLVDNKRAIQFRDQTISNFRAQLRAGAPSNADEERIRTLVRHIREKKVEIRLFTRYPLHAKLYLAHRTDNSYPRVGYVGSSNLTLAGLTSNGELNVDVPDVDATAKLQGWFEERWDDDLCIPIEHDILEVVEQSWAREALIPPYHIYLKMAYHLSRDAREGLSEFGIPAIFGNKLYEFQSAAVKIAAHHLEKNGGVLIGDVVGLGKTLMATALAKLREENYGDSTLIICPPNLVDMWEWYREEYQLGGKVVPLSMAQKVLPDLRRYNIVLIDESHILRNTDTGTYRAVRSYIEQNNCRCILLSATPYNKQYGDLAAQIRLFESTDRDLGIRPEAAIRAAGGDLEFTSKHQVNLRTLPAFEKSEEPDDWKDLMRRYLVRRTRTFIQEHYTKVSPDGRKYLEGHDGEKSYFPTRVPKTVKFAMENDGQPLPYARMASDDVVDRINALELARYGLGEYVDHGASANATVAEAEVIKNLGQAGFRLKGFSRTNMLKRLESSGHSFLLSARRHLVRNEVFIHALENGLPVPASVKGGADYQPDVVNSDEDEDVHQLNLVDRDVENSIKDIFTRSAVDHYETLSTQRKNRHNWLPADYFVPTLVDSLRKDARLLREILHMGADFAPGNDPKLKALRDLLSRQHPDEKLLIFTQYADTANYLNDQLHGHIDRLVAVTGSNENPAAIAKRFSPVSNNAKIHAHEEIRVLISTDVLSEGQNLQDSHIVVNYDLPWAIIKLIQRIGRVDRIGQQAEQIIAYSFLPADGIEELIQLRQRVQIRLRENELVVGADEVFFEGDVVDEDGLTNIYNEMGGSLDADSEEDEEVDITSYAWQIWKDATDENPALKKEVEDLDDVVFTSREHLNTSDDRSGVLVYVRTPEDTDALVRVDDDGNLISQSPLAVLRAAKCAPNTPAIPRIANHHLVVKEAAQKGMANAGSAGSGLGPAHSIRRRTYTRLRAYHQAHQGRLMNADYARYLPAIMEAMLAKPLRDSGRNALARVLRDTSTDEELIDAVIALYQEDLLVPQTNGNSQRSARIICSMGLVDTYRG